LEEIVEAYYIEHAAQKARKMREEAEKWRLVEEEKKRK